MQSEVTLREIIELEARAAREAVPALRDDLVSDALRRAGALVRERRVDLLRANRADVDAASDLDEGTLDRLRLDDGRLETTGCREDQRHLDDHELDDQRKQGSR